MNRYNKRMFVEIRHVPVRKVHDIRFMPSQESVKPDLFLQCVRTKIRENFSESRVVWSIFLITGMSKEDGVFVVRFDHFELFDQLLGIPSDAGFFGAKNTRVNAD